MISARRKTSAQHAPPVPFSTVVAMLCAILALALALRWPRDSESFARVSGETRLTRKGAAAKLFAPPPCAYGDRSAPQDEYSQWKETLLDTSYALPSSYRPGDLVSTANAGFAGDFQVRSLVIADLAALRRAAQAAGTSIDLVAAYRGYDQQADLFRRRESAVGAKDTLGVTARAGHSEHQLGTTVDFKTNGAEDVTTAWGSSPAGRWMKAHAYRFGFIQSYPPERSGVTCYLYEPWHFRYFGRPLAQKIHSSELTVREYLWAADHASAQN